MAMDSVAGYIKDAWEYWLADHHHHSAVVQQSQSTPNHHPTRPPREQSSDSSPLMADYPPYWVMTAGDQATTVDNPYRTMTSDVTSDCTTEHPYWLTTTEDHHPQSLTAALADFLNQAEKYQIGSEFLNQSEKYQINNQSEKHQINNTASIHKQVDDDHFEEYSRQSSSESLEMMSRRSNETTQDWAGALSEANEHSSSANILQSIVADDVDNRYNEVITPTVTSSSPSSGAMSSSSSDKMSVHVCCYCDREFANDKYLTMHLALHVNKNNKVREKKKNNETRTIGSNITRNNVANGDLNNHPNININTITKNNNNDFLLNGIMSATNNNSPSSTERNIGVGRRRQGSAQPSNPRTKKLRRLSSVTKEAGVEKTPRSLLTGGQSLAGSVVAPVVGGSVWTCDACGKKFAQNSNYKNHIRTHSNQRPFVCEICSIGFKERYHLKKHVLFKHTLELNEQCGQCGKRFKDSTAVRAHERTHSDLRPYSCLRCGKAFKTSECLWHHDHRSKACGAGRGEGGGGGGGVGAERGRAGFGSSGDTVNQRINEPHIMSCEESQKSQSPIRDKSNITYPYCSPLSVTFLDSLSASAPVFEYDSVPTSAASALINNGEILTYSTNTQNADVGQARVKSEVVFRASPTSSSSPETMFKEEQRSTSSNVVLFKSYQNDVHSISTQSAPTVKNRAQEDVPTLPGKGVKDFNALRDGTGVDKPKRASSKWRSTCGKCGKQFVSTSAFDKHILVHSEQRPYHCSLCDIGFKLKVHLKKHNLYRHNNDYPCKCNVCGKRFKDSSAVRLHERIHSTARPFECACGKSFKTKENLWGHRHRRSCDTGGGGTVAVVQPESAKMGGMRKDTRRGGPINGGRGMPALVSSTDHVPVSLSVNFNGEADAPSAENGSRIKIFGDESSIFSSFINSKRRSDLKEQSNSHDAEVKQEAFPDGRTSTELWTQENIKKSPQTATLPGDQLSPDSQLLSDISTQMKIVTKIITLSLNSNGCTTSTGYKPMTSNDYVTSVGVQNSQRAAEFHKSGTLSWAAAEAPVVEVPSETGTSNKDKETSTTGEFTGNGESCLGQFRNLANKNNNICLPSFEDLICALRDSNSADHSAAVPRALSADYLLPVAKATATKAGANCDVIAQGMVFARSQLEHSNESRAPNQGKIFVSRAEVGLNTLSRESKDKFIQESYYGFDVSTTLTSQSRSACHDDFIYPTEISYSPLDIKNNPGSPSVHNLYKMEEQTENEDHQSVQQEELRHQQHDDIVQKYFTQYNEQSSVMDTDWMTDLTYATIPSELEEYMPLDDVKQMTSSSVIRHMTSLDDFGQTQREDIKEMESFDQSSVLDYEWKSFVDPVIGFRNHHRVKQRFFRDDGYTILSSSTVHDHEGWFESVSPLNLTDEAYSAVADFIV